jgi:glyoxylase-like metal-dependent hydrolase (beta-lactamase superfamily II)
MVSHVTSAPAELLRELPSWVRLVRASNPGPMTLDGTNTWVLRAPRWAECIVVDPGPLEEGHLAAVARHAPVAFVLLTHGHRDHSDGIARLSDLLGGVPVMAADATHGHDPFDPDRDLSGHGFEIQPLATPGHTRDSVCFVVDHEGERAVLTGDTILGRGTAVVAYPDGDLGGYLDSLRRLEVLGAMPVLPGHGPALANCAAAARFYLEHRIARLEQVRQAVASGATTPGDMVAEVYADVDRVLWPAAELSVRAQLAYLGRESRTPPERLDSP